MDVTGYGSRLEAGTTGKLWDRCNSIRISARYNGRRRNRSIRQSFVTAMAHHHDHSHAHDHAGHSHAPDDFGWAFAIGATLNSAFVVAELVFGYAANSLALISDAVHNFSDVIALLLAWGAAWLAAKRPTDDTPTATGAPRSSLRCSTPACCWSRSAASPSRRSTGCASRRRCGLDRRVGCRSRHRRSMARPRCCSCAAATATSIFAAPICTWWRMRVSRSAWSSRRC